MVEVMICVNSQLAMMDHIIPVHIKIIVSVFFSSTKLFTLMDDDQLLREKANRMINAEFNEFIGTKF